MLKTDLVVLLWNSFSSLKKSWISCSIEALFSESLFCKVIVVSVFEYDSMNKSFGERGKKKIFNKFIHVRMFLENLLKFFSYDQVLQWRR